MKSSVLDTQDDRSDLCSVDTTLAFPSLLHRHDSPTVTNLSLCQLPLPQVSKETQMESNVDRIPSGQSTWGPLEHNKKAVLNEQSRRESHGSGTQRGASACHAGQQES